MPRIGETLTQKPRVDRDNFLRELCSVAY